MLIYDDNGLEIHEHTGPAYERTMHFEQWRVAIANYCEKFDKEKYDKIERHLLTDEVFVLLSGSAELVIGKELRYIPLEPGKIYNVKAGTWHNILLSQDGKVLIVENHNTGLENSEYWQIKGEDHE